MGKNLVAAFQTATKNANATLILLRLWYWSPRSTIVDEDGRWVANSMEEWAEETGLSHQQVKDAFARLKRLSLVKTDVRNWRRRRVMHTCLTSRAYMVGSVKWHLSEGSNDPSHEGQMTPLYIEQEIHISNAKQDMPEPAVPATTTGEDEMPPFGKKFTMADVAKGNTPKKPRVTLKAQKKVQTLTQLAGVWRETYAEVYNEFVPEFMKKQLGLLKHLLKDVDGDFELASRVVETCVRYWPDFAEKTYAVQTSAKPYAPAKPVLEFFTTYRAVAINFTQKFKPPKVVAAPQPKAQAPAPKAPDKAPQSDYTPYEPAELSGSDFFGDD